MHYILWLYIHSCVQYSHHEVYNCTVSCMYDAYAVYENKVVISLIHFCWDSHQQ